MSLDVLSILHKYSTSPEAFFVIQTHSQAVMAKALKIAQLFPEADKEFIAEATMLHDIGCFFVNAPKIHCFGPDPYVRHIVIGGEILRQEDLPRHARVAESHSGVGMTKEEILACNLPLPHQDYKPETLEEKIISFADLFFSKSNKDRLQTEESESEVLADLGRYGQEKIDTYFAWKKELKQE